MFLDLPLEIIVHVLLELSPQDLLACQLANRYLNSIVRESVVLQYAAALVSAGAEDNPRCHLPAAEKLQALNAAEKAWSFVRPGFSKSVPVSEVPSGVYDLTGGVYFLCNSARTALHYLGLPGREGDEISWKKIESTKKIIDIGLCLYEHDLLVLVTTTHQGESDHDRIRYQIELELLEFSTGKPHPQAGERCIKVMDSPREMPSIGIEIVGDHLVLILSFHNEGRPNDRIFIYEWQTNVLKTSFLAPNESYSDLLFLTEHLILLPNRHSKTLDIFRIPTTPTLVSPTPVLTLGLPALADEHILGAVSCRAEPNPIGAASHMRKKRQGAEHANSDWEGDGAGANAGVAASQGSHPKRAFIASSEDAICVFDLRVLALEMVLDPGGGLTMSFEPRQHLSFLAHRNAFVSLVNEYGKTSEDNPTCNMLWAQWGPPITRWFTSDGLSNHWITSTAGQRYVRLEEDLLDNGVPLYVMDFNQANIRRMKKYWAEEGDEENAHGEKGDPEENEKAARLDKGKGVSKDETFDGPTFVQGSSSSSSTTTFAPFLPPPVVYVPPGPTTALYKLAQELAGDVNSTNPYQTENIELEDEDGHDNWETDSGSSVGPPIPLIRKWRPPGENRIWASSGMEEVESTAFAERVEGRLPYVGCASEAWYAFDGVLMDEERTIGLKISDSGTVESVEIHHFG